MEIDPDDLDLTTRVLKVVESGSLPIGTLFCVGRRKVDPTDGSATYIVYGVNDRNTIDRRIGIIRVPKSDDPVPDLSDESTDLKLFTELGEPVLLDAKKPEVLPVASGAMYASFLEFESKNNLHKTQTKGDGDCFYTSIVLCVRHDPAFQKKWREGVEAGSDLAWINDLKLEDSNDAWIKHFRQLVASKYTATMYLHARESALLSVNPREYIAQYLKRRKGTPVSETNVEGDIVLHTDGKYYYTMDDGTHELIEGDDVPFKACWSPETSEARNKWYEEWREPSDHDDYMQMYKAIAGFKTLKQMTTEMLKSSYYADEAAIKIVTDYISINLVLVSEDAGQFVLKQCYTNYKYYMILYHKNLHYQPMIRMSDADNRAIWRKKELDVLSKGCKSRTDPKTPAASFLESPNTKASPRPEKKLRLDSEVSGNATEPKSLKLKKPRPDPEDFSEKPVEPTKSRPDPEESSEKPVEPTKSRPDPEESSEKPVEPLKPTKSRRDPEDSSEKPESSKPKKLRPEKTPLAKPESKLHETPSQKPLTESSVKKSRPESDLLVSPKKSRVDESSMKSSTSVRAKDLNDSDDDVSATLAEEKPERSMSKSIPASDSSSRKSESSKRNTTRKNSILVNTDEIS